MIGIETQNSLNKIRNKFLPSKDIVSDTRPVKNIRRHHNLPIVHSGAGEHIEILSENISRSLTDFTKRLDRGHLRMLQIFMKLIGIGKRNGQTVPFQSIIAPFLHLRNCFGNQFVMNFFIGYIEEILAAPRNLIDVYRILIFPAGICHSRFVCRTDPKRGYKTEFSDFIRHIFHAVRISHGIGRKITDIFGCFRIVKRRMIPFPIHPDCVCSVVIKIFPLPLRIFQHCVL